MTAVGIRERLRNGEAVVGGWCAIANSYSAEIVAHARPDYVAIDMQHGLADFTDVVPMLQAIAVHGPTPIVRVPQGDHATAQRVLDAGAEGVIFPVVNSAEDASAAVATCRFPPGGARSYGPIRARMHLGLDPEIHNREVLCLVQVETVTAVEHLAEILAAGVDGVYVGPNDLALSLGLPVSARDDTAITEILDNVVAACRASELIPAIHTTSGGAARAALERGFRMATVTSDAALLANAYERELAGARGGTARLLEGVHRVIDNLEHTKP